MTSDTSTPAAPAGDSLIDDGARAMVGTELERADGVVTEREFQRWAAAVGDYNPLYFDIDYARAKGYPDLVMPPMYLPHATTGVVALDDRRPDGIPNGTGTGGVPLSKCPRRLAGGDDIRFHATLHPGDVITSVRWLAAIEQKVGRSGPFVLMTFVTTYRRSADEVVAEATKFVIARPSAETSS